MNMDAHSGTICQSSFVRNRLVPALLALQVASVAAAQPNFDGTNRRYTDQRPAEILAWRWPVTVDFGNGSSQTVLLRRTPTLIGAVTDSLAGEYPAMRAAAQLGNPDVAFGLYSALAACAATPRDPASLEIAVDQLRSQGLLRVRAVPGGEQVVTIPPGQHRVHAEEGLREQARICTGLTDAQIRETEYWLQRAIEGGVPWALLEVAQRRSPEQMRTNEGLRAWDKVWSAGSISALGWLAMLHRSEWSSQPDRPPDLETAYAYQFLLTRLKRAKADATGSKRLAGHADQMEKSLAEFAATLSPAARQSGLARAAQILAASENCCYLD